MNNLKTNKGRAMLILWINDAAKIAAKGGGHYIACTRDGLRSGLKWVKPSDVATINAAINFIQLCVIANNIAKKAKAETIQEPDNTLASNLVNLAARLRAQWGFGNQEIKRQYGAALTIGGISWTEWNPI